MWNNGEAIRVVFSIRLWMINRIVKLDVLDEGTDVSLIISINKH